MSSLSDSGNEAPFYNLTRKKADRLVIEVLDTDSFEPEAFVRLLLISFDNAQEPSLKEALHELIKVVYDHFLIHAFHLDEYIESVNQGQNIVRETRARWLDCQRLEA